MATNTSVDIGTLIESTPGVCGGRPRLAGTRVPVSSIAVWHSEGMTPEQIVESHGHIDLAQVYAALAHYYANKPTINAAIAEEAALYDRLAAEYPTLRTPEPDATS